MGLKKFVTELTKPTVPATRIFMVGQSQYILNHFFAISFCSIQLRPSTILHPRINFFTCCQSSVLNLSHSVAIIIKSEFVIEGSNSVCCVICFFHDKGEGLLDHRHEPRNRVELVFQ